jgi:bifunctional non-homologous end joining protein LigD
MSLIEYNKKRAFEKTPEPKGKAIRSSKKPLQFVVQKHDASRLHYDFRLELDGVLLSWAVPKGPSMNPKDKRLAMMTEDHPVSYANFEGEIPKGQYGGGEVIVWDRGVYMSAESADPEESRKKLKSGYHKGDMKFLLLGEKLKGQFALVKLKNDDPKAWLLIKKEDEYATDADVTVDVSSVLSKKKLSRDSSSKNLKKLPSQKKKNVSRGKRTAMPHGMKPMLATLVDEAFDKEGWIFEIKWDGYRAVAEIEKNKVTLYSRNGNPFNQAYPSIVEALKKISHECVLDGEIIAYQDGRVSFQALQHLKQVDAPLQYVVFDVLYLDGRDVRSLPLIERKQILKEILPADEPLIALSEHIETHGKKFFEAMKKQGMEGMMAKNGLSPYMDGKRTDDWLKVKVTNEQEAIIVGYTAPRGSRKLIGALVLAVYQNKTLHYIGHSGGGFTESDIQDLYKKLQKIEVEASPIPEKVPVNSPITWVRPRYICQVKFSEWTKDGRMRHPIYKGLRTDKSPEEVTKEKIIETEEISNTKESPKASDELKLTHTDKIFWPDEGYTKGHLLAYYDEMADILLPYLKDRPQNLNRHPNGIKGQSFFQKNMDMAMPSFVETKRIWSESNREYIEYIVCNNKDTLLYLVNLGCIELNPWNSRVTNLDQPDYMIFDIDPNGRPFEDVITVAKEIQKVLDKSCEMHFPKTSGKSGLHILVPIDARYPYDEVRRFSELIMQLVHRSLPEMTSLERSPAKRKEKIYLDYLQNRFGQTLACAYSVRPYPGATVSTPLEWNEVKKGLSPSKFTIKTIPKRLEAKGDLWKPVLEQRNDLSDAIKCLEEEMEL